MIMSGLVSPFLESIEDEVVWLPKTTSYHLHY